MRGFRKALPIVAAVAGICMVGGIIYTSFQKKSITDDTGETRNVVESTISRFVLMQPKRIDDWSYLEMFRGIIDEQYIASAWLFDLNGRLVDVSGTKANEKNVDRISTEEKRGIVDSLPTNLLSRNQKTAVLVASAIQREGTHNDVFGHLVREVKDRGNETVGFLGIAYDINPNVGNPEIGWIIAVVMTGLSLVVYWITLPVWVFMDARSRGERAAAWAVFVLIGNLVALLGYILSKTPLRASEERENSKKESSR